MPKVAVVTGASPGVGRATVEEFAKQGYDVALLARDPDRLERVAGELRSAHGVRALAIPTDVADSAAVEAAASKVEIELGQIDVWVNVAMATVRPGIRADGRGGRARHTGYLSDAGPRYDGRSCAHASLQPWHHCRCRVGVGRTAASTVDPGWGVGRCSRISTAPRSGPTPDSACLSPPTCSLRS